MKTYKRKLIIKIISLIAILVILSTVYSQNKSEPQNKSESQKSEYEYKIFNLKEYLYNNLKISQEDYKFISVKQNYQGEVIYFLQLYKAKGMLLVYYDFNTNVSGYRIIPEIKSFNTTSFNPKREILINSLAMGNKFYYISPKVKIHSFESPSYNLSEPLPGKDYFYWIGYKYDKNKRTDRKLHLFRYKYNNVENFDISEIKNNFDKNGYKILDLKLINDNLFLNVLNKNKNYEIFQYNLISKEMKNIFSSKFIIFDPNPSTDDLIFLEEKDKVINVFKFRIIDEEKEKILSVNLDKTVYNFYCLENKSDKFLVLFNLVENKEEKIFRNVVLEGNNKIFENIFEAPANVYSFRNKFGIFYIYEEGLAEVKK
ncbi:MAG: hypothetical protein ACK4GJ_03650 [bacterium]